MGVVQSEGFKKYKGRIAELNAKARERDPEKYIEDKRKAGRASKDRAKFKDVLLKLLGERVKASKDGKEVEMTRQEKLCYEVLGDVGNKVKALEVIRDTIGEKPTDKVEMKAEITPDKAMAFSHKILGIKPTKADPDNNNDDE